MNQNELTVSDFYAKNVFPQWEKLVTKAKRSVVIYSPFINVALNDLLEHVNIQIQVEIITRIDKSSLFGKGGVFQLEALIKASKRSRTSIYELPNLHAKILLVDGEFVSMGSQNFTKRGQKSKEASMSSETSFINSEFLKQIIIWKKEAKLNGVQSTSSLNNLLSKIREELENSEKNKDALGKKIEKVKREYEKPERQEHDYITKGPALLSRNEKNNLKCASRQQLNKWKKKSTNMEKGAFYPVVNMNTKRVVFARVNKREMSFVDNEKNCEEFVEIGGKKYGVKIDLPNVDERDINSEVVNVKAIFKNSTNRQITVKYFFDGKDFNLKTNRNTRKTEKYKIIKELESKKYILFSFFEPSNLGILNKKHIADEFAIGSKYKARIRVVEDVEFMLLEALE